ncbi:NECAP-1 protein [Vigna unguiculata]|uniref:NECAP-1 protein n=1 Tax=Vigna unguiculata TaxID=3917 RepID=A0A4D6LC04_VIGUN|nr:NECAP-1 protein [Vigna unguiculata]
MEQYEFEIRCLKLTHNHENLDPTVCTSSDNYKCSESNKIWPKRIHIVSHRDYCEYECNEPVLNLSCYFILKIEDDYDMHTFIRLGINERNKAFDFSVTLSYHEI